eukprot:1137725-Pelagomonas_calceolata.AAC.2
MMQGQKKAGGGAGAKRQRKGRSTICQRTSPETAVLKEIGEGANLRGEGVLQKCASWWGGHMLVCERENGKDKRGGGGEGENVWQRAVPQAYAYNYGQQLLAASLATSSLLGCRLQLCSADTCWAWLTLFGRLIVLTLLAVE